MQWWSVDSCTIILRGYIINATKQFMWFNVKYLAMGSFYCIFHEALTIPLTYSLPNCVQNTSVIQNKYCGLLEPNSLILLFQYSIFIYFRDSEIYIKYYMNIFQTMVLGVLPFGALIFFNIKIYHRFMVTRGRFQARGNRGSTQVSIP